ncbi:fibronectin type III domain-containing protein 2-like [Haliotis asinina]|uniref:fibronectin type III domain-containing protein 2-like n=1 Tax=Haliotis asinina TaxID=109174 RepID=UPI003532418B
MHTYSRLGFIFALLSFAVAPQNAGTSFSYDECNGNMFYKVKPLTSYTDYVVVIAAAFRDTIGENVTLAVKTDIGVPGPPTNIRFTAVNESAVFVKWDIPSHNAGPMAYKVTVLQARNRTSSRFMVHHEYLVEGWTSSELQVPCLLSSWRYMVTMTAGTIAGNSPLAKSKPVTTLPVIPSAVQNIHVKFVPSEYLAVRLIWECAPEKKRNGHITNYTVKYTGNASMTMTVGSFYPEDPCTHPHTVYLPVLPDEKTRIEIWANAEFKGDEASMVFLAD